MPAAQSPNPLCRIAIDFAVHPAEAAAAVAGGPDGVRRKPPARPGVPIRPLAKLSRRDGSLTAVEVRFSSRLSRRPGTRSLTGRSGVGRVLLALAFLWAGTVSGYHLDAGNTRLSFVVNRFGLRWMSAQFRELTGEFALDASGQGGRLDVAVRTASVDCADTYWSERLRSPEWLDTARFPEMLYRSTRIDFEGQTRAKVYGDLTLHGVTHPVTLTVTDIRCEQSGDGGGHCSFAARAQLKRSDFKLPHGFWQGGDAVEIFVRGS